MPCQTREMRGVGSLIDLAVGPILSAKRPGKYRSAVAVHIPELYQEAAKVLRSALSAACLLGSLIRRSHCTCLGQFTCILLLSSLSVDLSDSVSLLLLHQPHVVLLFPVFLR